MSRVINTSPDLVKTKLVSAKKNRGVISAKREKILMQNLMGFYSYSANLDQLLPVLLKKSKISLRILDWFVTNYAKEFRVGYKIIHLGRVKNFSVYDSYKAQLKAFHKGLFDPFCRGKRIFFEYYEGCKVETTVGQLNFFKWVIENKVLDYVENHLERISQHMSLMNKERIDSKKKSGEEESSNSTTTTTKSNTEVEISGELERAKNGDLIAKIGFC